MHGPDEGSGSLAQTGMPRRGKAGRQLATQRWTGDPDHRDPAPARDAERIRANQVGIYVNAVPPARCACNRGTDYTHKTLYRLGCASRPVGRHGKPGIDAMRRG